MQTWENFYGPNAGYVLDLYERYQNDPNSVDPATRAFFAAWPPPVDGMIAQPVPASTPLLDKVVAATNLANAIRDYGHLAALVDPIDADPSGDPALLPATHDITEDELRR